MSFHNLIISPIVIYTISNFKSTSKNNSKCLMFKFLFFFNELYFYVGNETWNFELFLLIFLKFDNIWTTTDQVIWLWNDINFLATPCMCVYIYIYIYIYIYRERERESIGNRNISFMWCFFFLFSTNFNFWSSKEMSLGRKIIFERTGCGSKIWNRKDWIHVFTTGHGSKIWNRENWIHAFTTRRRSNK